MLNKKWSKKMIITEEMRRDETIILNGPTRLMVAAVRGDIERMKLLLDEGANINERANTATALICAAAAGQKDAVVLLLDRGAETQHQDQRGASARFYAAARGYDGIVQLIDIADAKRAIVARALRAK